MNEVMMRSLIAFVLVLAACGSTVELAGTDLPVAASPATVEQATWGLPFVAEFPAGYWSEGGHRYRFVIDCPVLPQGEIESIPLDFRVTTLTRTLNGPVYIRMGGLSDGIMMPANVGAVHPDQQTVAAVTFLGLDEVTTSAASDQCVGVMEFDGDQSEPMVPG
jgi:hypothetical protein